MRLNTKPYGMGGDFLNANANANANRSSAAGSQDKSSVCHCGGSGVITTIKEGQVIATTPCPCRGNIGKATLETK